MSAVKTGSTPAINGPFRRLLLKIGLATAALLIAVLGLTFVPAGSPASAAEVNQCNGVANGGGQGLNCDVTVTNNLDVETGAESSTIVVTECRGDANTDLTCTTTPTNSSSLTTKVEQCNDAAIGGGSSVICNVSVTNNVTGAASTDVTGATVNQCNGSGAEGTEPTLNCDPIPVSTTEATITQCNGSANGGGASMRVTCTVDPSTVSAELPEPVTIDQCNRTANGGGSVVTCNASLTNVFLPSALATSTPTPTATAAPQNQAAATPTPSATAAPVGKNTLHDSRTDGFTPTTDEGGDSVVALGIGGLLMAALLIGATRARRVSARL